MSSKFPNDGLTDVELAELEKRHKVAQSGELDFLEDYTRYEEDYRMTEEDKAEVKGRTVRIELGEEASRTRPFYTKELAKDHNQLQFEAEEQIRRSYAFEGKWQTYIEKGRLMIPEAYQPLVKWGGVVTVSAEKHLLLFGGEHWARFQRLLAKEIGINPDRNAVGRHIYSNAMHFNKLADDGSIELSDGLINYARLKDEVALIGLVYFAEVHAKADYYDKQLDPDTVAQLARALV